METLLVTVEKLLYGGDALARRDDGKTVFIPYAVPGDRLLVGTCAEKKNYIRAEILEILKPGAGRVAPLCVHFGKCGGCSWQQIEYSLQVEAKRQILEELFHHRFPETGRLAIAMRPCPKPFGYRSRARLKLHAGRKTAIGFFRGGSHFVEDVENCPLFLPRLNDALQELRRASIAQFKANRNDYIHHIREIDIACSDKDAAWTTAKSGVETLLQRSVGDFIYNTAAGTFFQANDFMTGALVSHVIDCVSQNSGPVKNSSGVALDLFSGVGLFSLPLARRFSAVIAVEHSRESHRFCEMNAAGAGIENLENVCAGVAEWLNSQTASSFDCVVLDPPRTGAGPDVMEQVGRLASGTIVYVSCDPQTLARDLARLDMDRLRIVSITGFDMFPQTYHFETVVHLCCETTNETHSCL
jgi:23S rRNA (uracil1939-C5)-methyltransferase